jgi:hypothetical protein
MKEEKTHHVLRNNRDSKIPLGFVCGNNEGAAEGM